MKLVLLSTVAFATIHVAPVSAQNAKSASDAIRRIASQFSASGPNSEREHFSAGEIERDNIRCDGAVTVKPGAECRLVGGSRHFVVGRPTVVRDDSVEVTIRHWYPSPVSGVARSAETYVVVRRGGAWVNLGIKPGSRLTT